MTGKNFSGNSGPRRKADFYETPFCLTRLLLDKIDLSEWDNKSVLEPACGRGAIISVLNDYGIWSRSYDIKDGTDFLKETRHWDIIITNPPFSLAFEFIVHAMAVSDNFYYLLPLSYLHGKTRHDKIYTDPNCTHYLKRVFVFTRYPLLGDQLRSDGKHRTGMMVYAWFHFSRGDRKSPIIEWLDNDPYVLRS